MMAGLRSLVVLMQSSGSCMMPYRSWCVQVITAVERVMRLKNAALFIDNFETTGLLAPNPVDNT